MFQILLKSAQELKRTDIFLFKNTNVPQSAPGISVRKLDMNFIDFETGSYDFMKNKQGSDKTERKSARAATVCLHLNSSSFYLSLSIGLFPFLSQNVIIPNNSKK